PASASRAATLSPTPRRSSTSSCSSSASAASGASAQLHGAPSSSEQLIRLSTRLALSCRAVLCGPHRQLVGGDLDHRREAREKLIRAVSPVEAATATK